MKQIKEEGEKGAYFKAKYGSGIYLENELCLKNGNEKPVYEITSNQTKVIFKSQVKEITVIEFDEDILKTLNERQRRAIDYFRSKGRITTKEYTRLFNISVITAKRDLLYLKEKKIIAFVGSPKTGYYCFYDTVNDTVKGDKK